MNTTQAEWRDATLTLLGTRGTSTQPGKELFGSGLGYWTATPEPNEGHFSTFYVPIHLLSGYRVHPDPFYDEQTCQQFIQEIAALADWNQPMDAVVAVLNAPSPQPFGEICKRYWIEDAAQSCGGGQW